MLTLNSYHVRTWLESNQIQEWLQSFPNSIAQGVLENLPKLIESYDPLNFGAAPSILIEESDAQLLGFDRCDLKFWFFDEDANPQTCDYSLQDHVDSLPTSLRDDFRKGRIMAEQGMSRSQIYEILNCRPNADLENLIALGAERRECKSDFRKATEDHHFPSVVRLLKRFGWRIPD